MRMCFNKDRFVVFASVIVLGLVASWPRLLVAAGLSRDPGLAVVNTDREPESATAKSDYVVRLGFLPGSATLYKGGKNRLQPIIDEWARAGAVTIVAVGHTSTEAIPERNRKEFKDHHELSHARALVIAEYIAQQLGVPEENVTVVGRGTDEPLLSNESPRGREFNDRVEIAIALAFADPLPVTVLESPFSLKNAGRSIAQSNSSLQVPRTPAPDIPDDSTSQPAVVGVPTTDGIDGGTNTIEFAGGVAEVVDVVVVDDVVEIVEEFEEAFEPLAIASYSGEDIRRFASSNSDWDEAEVETFDSHPSVTGMPSVNRRKTIPASRWSASLGGRVGTAYNSNIFEEASSPTSTGILDTALRGELSRDVNPNDRLTIWAGATAAPRRVAGAPDEYTGVFGTAFRHRLSKNASVSMVAQGKMENDDVVNKEGEDPLRKFAHSDYQAQPSLQLRTKNNSLIWVSYVVQRRNFREQVELNSLDWWQHGPSIKLRSHLGRRGAVEVDYSFRVQAYDEEQASLRTGKFLETNPTERHRFDRVEADLFFEPNSNLELIAGYCVERKEDSFLGFESWTNQCVRTGLNAIVGRRITFRSAVSYDHRKYDNRIGDDRERLQYSRLSAEASVGYRLSRAVTLYGSVWAANRDSNRSIGDEYLDLGVFRMSSGATFAY